MPPNAHALAERLRRDFDRFSPAQQSLARYLSEHLAEIPMLSAHEIARTAHCSPATVVRFAQTLGYAGYPEMQRVVRDAQRPSIPELREGGTTAPLEGLGAVLARERSALDDASQYLRSPGLNQLVVALRDRAPLFIAGEGQARPVVSLLEERLGRAGVAVVPLTALGAAERAWLDAVTPRAGVLVIAVGRETRVGDATLAAAQAAGAPAGVLVDSPVSPLARPPLARVVPCDANGPNPSLVPMIAVAQALADALVRPASRRLTQAA
jgi:DNA-binding MurR/RpiR family transcriptional regulator